MREDLDLVPACLGEGRPFTRAVALAAGVSPDALRGPRYRAVYRGVFVAATTPDSAWIRIAGALSVHPPSAFASYTSAARLHGIPVPDESNEHVSVFEQGDRRQRVGIVCHVARGSTAVVLHDRLRVSPPMQTFVELAALLSLVDLVAAGDALIRRCGFKAKDLVEFCVRFEGHHGAAARRAAAYVRDEVDSPMESRLRMLIVLSGLPEPVVNYKFRDDYGEVVGDSTSATQTCGSRSSTTVASTPRTQSSGTPISNGANNLTSVNGG